jgi:curved DNA-binding protein CbpA
VATDDYYSLLGVDETAATNDIRDAYRAKKAALDAKGDKGEVARVNKAWNVLSDPYQRGRYDEQRARSDGAVEVVDADSVPDGSGNGTPPRRRGFFQPATPREPRAALEPTIDVPEGQALAAQKPRMMALAIDVFVMLLILFGLQIAVSDALTERWYPEEHAALEELREDPAGDEKSERQDAYDDLLDEDSDLSRTTAPAGIAVLEAALLLCFAYLVIPSALSGQTLGKKLRNIRVVRMDGSPLGWKGAVVRYGTILLAANFLLILMPLFGILGLLLLGGLFFLVLGWMRNPNKQAMQDRLAKTLVVDA